MASPSLLELKQAAQLVYQYMSPTPQIQWPQINQELDAEVWLKHENHTPTGAFKVRGGITYLHWLKSHKPEVRGIVTATRGNHGQSLARAARNAGLTVKIVVPLANSKEKNAAMRAFGAELIEHGNCFDDAIEHAQRLARQASLTMVPSFHSQLVLGVASYALELFQEAGELDRVYVPIGLGSGICGVIAARDALGFNTQVIGVVSELAAGAKLSFEANSIISTPTAETFADGMAVCQPNADALTIYKSGVKKIISVSELEIKQAIRWLFSVTHNVAEGAGAAALAAIIKDRRENKDKRIAAIVSGGNIDSELFCSILGKK